MAEREDYYQILGVDPEASQEEIRKAYHGLAQRLHPDHLGGRSESARRWAEERLKEINEAYEVLGNSQKRQQYDIKWRAKPKPVVDPAYFHFKDVKPGEIQKASFVVQNAGGPYAKFSYDVHPGDWVRVVRGYSLTDSDELPLRMEIEAEGEDWDETYSESIIVELDEEATEVKVELQTKPEPARASVGAIPRTKRTTYAPPPPVTHQRVIPTWLKWSIGIVALILVIVIVRNVWPSNEIGCGGVEVRSPEQKSQPYELRWSFSLSGDKTAAPIDLNSNGILDGLVVVVVGKPCRIYTFNSDGELEWSYEMKGTHSGHVPHHLAPIDYDSDGKYDEMLLDIRGNVTEPGVIVIGQPEVYTFNFFVINSRAEQLWYYQCADPEHAFLPGMSLKCPRCDAEEADALYRGEISTYGYSINGRFIDQDFGRLDLDGDGDFDDSIRLSEDRVEVYRKVT